MSSAPTKWLLATLAAIITNHSWESLGPLPSQMIDRYD